MKKCTYCKTEKDASKFNSDNKNVDKLSYYCKECRKQHYRDNKDRIDLTTKKYLQEHKEQIDIYNKKYNKQYYWNNREKYKEYKENTREHRNSVRRDRRKNDLIYRLTENIRAGFCRWLKSNSKSKQTFDYINCSKEELIEYLESKFYDNPETGEKMTWDNWGLCGWHIDHIKPLSLFDSKNEEDMHKAWSKENLQPLWAKENLIKNNKYLLF